VSDQLLPHSFLWRARDQSGTSQPAGLPTGFASLDQCLPGGGWPQHGLVEILADRQGIGELSIFMPALAALCRETSPGGWLAWVAPPYLPYAPALAGCGIDVRRVLVVRARPADWAMEQALRSGACRAVLGWVRPNGMQGLRRLQLAAEQSQCLAVLFRSLRDAAEPSPAVLRIALRPDPRGLGLHILKSRGGKPLEVQLGSLTALVPPGAY
jgi:hypothetical protein